MLLENEASVTATTKKGFTPLHLASKYGNIKVTKLLLQKQAPVDAPGKVRIIIIHFRIQLYVWIERREWDEKFNVFFLYAFWKYHNLNVYYVLLLK